MVAVWPDELAANRPSGLYLVGMPAAKARSLPRLRLLKPRKTRPRLGVLTGLVEGRPNARRHSMYKKDGPYTIAVSQQDPSNGWVTPTM